MAHEFNPYDVYKVTSTLIGPIYAVADSAVDKDRLLNLDKMWDVISLLVTEIADQLPCINSNYHSMKTVGEKAYEILTDLNDYIAEALGRCRSEQC